MSIHGQWHDLVTVALLGTDRRDPPEADGLLGEFVADSARSDPSSRMLAQVAACTAIRRAGVRPAKPVRALAPPPGDDRPSCVPAAVDRWYHITTSWPVLEDEWMLTLISNGWRAAPELVPSLLVRHRRDVVRRARAMVAAGPAATWLIEHLPELDAVARRAPTNADLEAAAELPELPIPVELATLLERNGAEIGGALAGGLEDRTLGEAHRAVLVNLVARCSPASLVDLADVLDVVDPMAPGRGLAVVLADLATTRHRMLDELSTS